MSEKNNNNHYLSLKDLVSESLLRDLILFIFVFLLIIAQGWDNIFFLLFPLITFIFSLFFRILSTNKMKTEFENSFIIYYPLGLERKNANRLFYCTIFQLILILWLGGESLYNAHIVHNYFNFFLGLLIFLYTFSFFWIFSDSWKYTKIKIEINTSESKSHEPLSKSSRNLISYLSLKNWRMITYVSFLILIILNFLNMIFLFFINVINIGFQLILPGSQIMTISYIYVVFLIISPTITLIFLIKNYQIINKINKEKLDEILKILPRNVQIKIIENLKVLNNRIKEQLKSE